MPGHYLLLLFFILGANIGNADGPSFEKKLLENGESEGHKYKIEQMFVAGEVIWGMDWLPSGNLIFTQRTGEIFEVNWANNQVTLLAKIEAHQNGQGGLLDVALHPEFVKNKLLYFTYSKKVSEKESTTALGQATYQAGANPKLGHIRDLFVAKVESTEGEHYGSRITFDGQGHLFVSVGDRGHRENAQKLNLHAGKIIRLHYDGRIPKDNPFVGQKDALPEIYSLGQRNPQGLFFDVPTNTLWEIEHGPRGGDEINWIKAGKNYGWPVITYGKEYWGPVSIGEGTAKEGMEQPLKYYVPSIAPCDLLIYRGAMFAKWQGHVFMGALAGEHLNQVIFDGAKEVKEIRLLQKLEERIRSLSVDSKGALWLGTDSGKLLRMEAI